MQLITVIYIGINIVFALIYLAIGDAIENARNGAFSDAFFLRPNNKAVEINYTLFHNVEPVVG